MIQVSRDGDWGRVNGLIRAIQGEMRHAQQISLMRFALKAEAVAKGHISAQDLGWAPLNARTIASKTRSGYSSNIYVASGTYFRNITGWVDGETARAGVKRGVREGSGLEVGELAKILEFGSPSRNMPARPLWQPTFDETVQWTIQHNNPAQIAVDRLRRY